MNIVRYDTVGSIQMKLIRRPTNTAVGVDNFHIWAEGKTEGFPAPILRFIGTDEENAHYRYDLAKLSAQAAFEP